MSDLKKQMALWEWRMVTLEDCPKSEVEEIKEAIREDWVDPEKRAYWEWRIAEEARFSQELLDMGKAVTERIKARICAERLEKGPGAIK